MVVVLLLVFVIPAVGQQRLPVYQFNRVSVEVQGGFDFPFQPWHIIRDGNNVPILDVNGNEQQARLKDYRAYGGQFGVRYMFNSAFGLKAHYAYHHFYTTVPGVGTFLRFHRYGIEGVFNVGSLFGPKRFYETRRFNVLVHAGGGFTHGKPSSLFRDTRTMGWKHEDIWSGIVGVTPQYRITNWLVAYADVSMHVSGKQHYGYHGRYLHPGSDRSETGVFMNTSIGLQWYLGNKPLHLDWR